MKHTIDDFDPAAEIARWHQEKREERAALLRDPERRAAIGERLQRLAGYYRDSVEPDAEPELLAVAELLEDPDFDAVLAAAQERVKGAGE